jgi:hypothetical protein
MRAAAASVRSYHVLPAYNAALAARQAVTLEQASERLGISHKVIRRLIEANKIPATQVVPWARCEIPIEAIESAEVVQEVVRAKRRPQNLWSVTDHRCRCLLKLGKILED